LFGGNSFSFVIEMDCTMENAPKTNQFSDGIPIRKWLVVDRARPQPMLSMERRGRQRRKMTKTSLQSEHSKGCFGKFPRNLFYLQQIWYSYFSQSILFYFTRIDNVSILESAPTPAPATLLPLSPPPPIDIVRLQFEWRWRNRQYQGIYAPAYFKLG